jgi:hypothetical protein
VKFFAMGVNVTVSAIENDRGEKVADGQHHCALSMDSIAETSFLIKKQSFLVQQGLFKRVVPDRGPIALPRDRRENMHQ